MCLLGTATGGVAAHFRPEDASLELELSLSKVVKTNPLAEVRTMQCKMENMTSTVVPSQAQSVAEAAEVGAILDAALARIGSQIRSAQKGNRCAHSML
jgi:hypothetical protein